MYPKPEMPPADGGMTDTAPTPCGDGCGTLPACAALAFPHVPFQQESAKKYDQTDALQNGTLFPGLNLPFRCKPNASPVPQGPLAELQALEFVLTELGLYLDTHAGDAQAMELFRQYAALEREGRRNYEAMYGPLTQAAVADSKTYTWHKDPWPWCYQEGGKQ